jgi:uncharacterized protein (TIGR02172 family)
MTQDMTLTLDRRIGEGRTAEIYAWGDAEVLKLYRPGWPTSSVEQEAHISCQVAQTRLPVPAVGGMVEVDGRLGIVFERVAGKSLVQHFVTRPWTLLNALHAFTDLHLAMHAQVLPDLPSQRQRLIQQIQDAAIVPAAARQAALSRLEQLPDGQALCHGDYHPENVLMTRHGPIILDWAGATSGHPLADVARTALIVQMAALLPSERAHWLLASVRNRVGTAYIRRYLRQSPARQEELAAWHLPILVARLGDGIAEEQEPLLRLLQTIRY